MLAIAFVSFSAWFTLSFDPDWNEMLGSFSTGATTLMLVLVAGGLLAFAFDRGQQAVVVLLKPHPDDDTRGR